MGILDPGDDTFKNKPNKRAIFSVGILLLGILVFLGVAAKQTGLLNNLSFGSVEETTPSLTPSDNLTEPAKVEGETVEISPTEEPTKTPTPTAIKVPTKVPVKTPTPKPTSTSTPTPTPTPTLSPSPTLTVTPIITPTLSVSPTVTTALTLTPTLTP